MNREAIHICVITNHIFAHRFFFCNCYKLLKNDDFCFYFNASCVLPLDISSRVYFDSHLLTCYCFVLTPWCLSFWCRLIADDGDQLKFVSCNCEMDLLRWLWSNMSIVFASKYRIGVSGNQRWKKNRKIQIQQNERMKCRRDSPQ